MEALLSDGQVSLDVIELALIPPFGEGDGASDSSVCDVDEEHSSDIFENATQPCSQDRNLSLSPRHGDEDGATADGKSMDRNQSSSPRHGDEDSATADGKSVESPHSTPMDQGPDFGFDVTLSSATSESQLMTDIEDKLSRDGLVCTTTQQLAPNRAELSQQEELMERARWVVFLLSPALLDSKLCEVHQACALELAMEKGVKNVVFLVTHWSAAEKHEKTYSIFTKIFMTDSSWYKTLVALVKGRPGPLNKSEICCNPRHVDLLALLRNSDRSLSAPSMDRYPSENDVSRSPIPGGAEPRVIRYVHQQEARYHSTANLSSLAEKSGDQWNWLKASGPQGGSLPERDEDAAGIHDDLPLPEECTLPNGAVAEILQSEAESVSAESTAQGDLPGEQQTSSGQRKASFSESFWFVCYALAAIAVVMVSQLTSKTILPFEGVFGLTVLLAPIGCHLVYELLGPSLCWLLLALLGLTRLLLTPVVWMVRFTFRAAVAIVKVPIYVLKTVLLNDVD